jgi:hypothetical protein
LRNFCDADTVSAKKKLLYTREINMKIVALGLFMFNAISGGLSSAITKSYNYTFNWLHSLVNSKIFTSQMQTMRVPPIVSSSDPGNTAQNVRRDSNSDQNSRSPSQNTIHTSSDSGGSTGVRQSNNSRYVTTTIIYERTYTGNTVVERNGVTYIDGRPIDEEEDSEEQGSTEECVVASSEQRWVNFYHQLEVSGKINVTLKPLSLLENNGEKSEEEESKEINKELGKMKLLVSGDSAILKKLITRVDGRVLKIYLERGRYKLINPLSVILYLNSLRQISASSFGNIIMKKQDWKDTSFAIDQLNVHSSGSNTIVLCNLVLGKLCTHLSSFGNIHLQGFAENHEAKISGSGNLEAVGLETEISRATVSSFGHATLWVNSQLWARISGSGNISYKGNATVMEKRISSFGNLKRIRG